MNSVRSTVAGSLAPLALLLLLTRRSRAVAVAMIAFEAMLPAVTALVTGRATAQASLGAGVAGGLVALVIVIVVQQVYEIAVFPIREELGREIDWKHRRRLVSAAYVAVGPSPFEDDKSVVLLSESVSQLGQFTAGRAASHVLIVVGQFAAGLLCAAILIVEDPLAGLGTVLFLLLARRFTIATAIGLSWVSVRSAAVTRQAQYWARVATNPASGKDVRVYGLADWVIGKWSERFTTQRAPIWSGRSRLVWLAWVPFLLTGVAAYLAFSLIAEHPTPEQLSQNILALYGLLGLGAVSWDVYVLQHGKAPLQAGRSFERRLAATRPLPAPAGRMGAGRAPGPPACGAPSISFDGVCFTYPHRTVETLSDMSVIIEPGEVFGLVGRNGAGKTTCMRLIQHLVAPDAGSVRISGRDASPMNVCDVRAGIAVVNQDAARFDLTLRQNVMLGAAQWYADGAFFDHIRPGLRLDDLAETLPNGWDTPLGRSRTGGTDLSGGQWQRVALARAVAGIRAGKRLVLLDEPTSHLDAEAELDTLRGLLAEARDATVVLVSHRLSIMRLVDRIGLIDGGRLAEIGTHNELVARESTYGVMFRTQANALIGGGR